MKHFDLKFFINHKLQYDHQQKSENNYVQSC